VKQAQIMDDRQAEFHVGSRQLIVEDRLNRIAFPVLIHYPTQEPSRPVNYGPYVMEVSPKAAIVEGKFPLVVISHGNGGSHLLYRSISLHLARLGYVVAMPEHYGNNRNNNRLENTMQNLIFRPRHISLTIDALLANPDFKNHILVDKIAVIGHSMGGYTTLALAGGIPYTKEAERVAVDADPRVKAIVLLAPGAGWFKGNLNRVNIPILMLAAEHDPVTPSWNADIVLSGVSDPSNVNFQKIKNAGHFSFLSPFPAAMKRPEFLPSTDPDGFDRDQFHQELPRLVAAFLEAKLKAGTLA
jgi:predicted dienelactone hydrolase